MQQNLVDDPANLRGERVRLARSREPLAVDTGAAAVAQSLRKLGTRASLMLIVAHPDDEDGGMLTYESRGHGVRTAMLTLNRGEGGQNVMTGDFNDALGLLRTEELLAADKVMGVDQLFGTEVDFGFSKTIEESFAQWGHERVLYDAVRAVRLYRPLVVAAVFVGGVTDGHGQHQVSGEIAQEVFTAAADPKIFPEMGLPAWTVEKVYARVPLNAVRPEGLFDYATGKYAPARFYNYVTKQWSETVPSTNVVVHEGDFDAVLGRTDIQQARSGLALQKTQNGGNMRDPGAGAFDVAYHRYGSRVADGEKEQSFFDGVDVSLAGIASLAPGAGGYLPMGLARLRGIVTQATKQFSAERPGASAPLLRDGLRETRVLLAQVEAASLPAGQKQSVLHELRVKEVQWNDALVEALGLRLVPEAASGGAYVAGGNRPLTADVTIRNNGGEAVSFVSAEAMVSGLTHPGPRSVQTVVQVQTAPGRRIGAGEVLRKTLEFPAPTVPTEPYFHRPDVEQPFYDIAPVDAALRNAPLTPPPASVLVTMEYGGERLMLAAPVWAAEMKAAETPSASAAVEAVPQVRVALAPQAGVVPKGEASFALTAMVASETDAAASGALSLMLPRGWTATPATVDFSLNAASGPKQVVFTVHPAAGSKGNETIFAVARTGGKEYRTGYRVAGYAGLPPINTYAPAQYRTSVAAVGIAPGLRVAYLPGTGDAVEESLASLGVHATTLTVADLLSGRLKGFDALVLGVRAYAAHRDLATATPALMAFAQAGGVVIVQYQTAEYRANDAPYPLSMAGGGEKVVEEHAPVELTGTSPVLQQPNVLSAADFAGWVEERGHGFMGTWDERYTAPTETHDAGQDPQRGGLLVAQVGKGYYVYCAFALYRQLPEGVVGAYRIFANMLSLGHMGEAMAHGAPPHVPTVGTAR
jgi:LmbE family N-acetylglucosaminyl deacetylase